jgi:DNA (cytosine-5)-methyltransferase 1
MTHKEKLLEIYNNLSISNRTLGDILSSSSLNSFQEESLKIIGDKIESQKGVYTVVITLSVHKILYPSQDIRYHQVSLQNGFSGRTIDTQYITPTLKELNLPSMSESGWLTRSLEQPYPYTKNYNGKISNPKVRSSFLDIVEVIQELSSGPIITLQYLLSKSIEIREKNKISLEPLTNPEKVTIVELISGLTEYFNKNYHTSGGSKLPVITFFSIYQILMKEVKRYEDCVLEDLGFHTTSDRTSKSSGDIEVKDMSGNVFESLEIKHDIEIDSHIIRRVREKILKFNPKRYYVLSSGGIKQEDYDEIMEISNELRNSHGCQLIINGLIPTLKYYFRLLDDLNTFIIRFNHNIISDKEIKLIHKKSWEEIYYQIQLNTLKD